MEAWGLDDGDSDVFRLFQKWFYNESFAGSLSKYLFTEQEIQPWKDGKELSESAARKQLMVI